jgi:protein ImuB
MKRVISLWFPYWPSERLARRRRKPSADRRSAGEPRPEPPVAFVGAEQGGLRLAAVSAAAGAEGLAPGMTLADARALVPGLVVEAADAQGDARALAALADWCIRFTPWVALDGADGLVLDVSGCARLFGGEAALLGRVVAALNRFGFTVRAALADTPAAAWAAARFARAADPTIVPPGGAEAMLGPLPVAALRLPVDTVAGLERLGLRRVAEVAALPRAPLAARFGEAVGRRIDRAFGREAEAIAPRRPVPAHLVRRVFTEPLIDHAGVVTATGGLIAELTGRLEAEGLGLRRLELALYRVDGGRRVAAVGTARATRDAVHIERLLAVKLEALELGFGVEALTLAAPVTEPLAPVQAALAPDGIRADAGGLGALVDRLAQRLGPANVVRFAPRPSHTPERAVAAVPAMAPAAADGWRADVHRPLRLLPRPEPIEAVAMVPDAPPVQFRWRGRAHRVARAAGPERLAAEWWRAPNAETYDPDDWRDYYRVEDAAGARFWLYRHGPYGPGGTARWYLHGMFA